MVLSSSLAQKVFHLTSVWNVPVRISDWVLAVLTYSFVGFPYSLHATFVEKYLEINHHLFLSSQPFSFDNK
jgi:hypothetical protein